MSRGPAASPNRFTRFACFDWSGQAVARPRGIALAVAEPDGPPRLIERPGGWSRDDALGWLRDIAASREPMLIGLDLSPGFPFADAGAYFPGWADTPPDVKALWAQVDRLSAPDPHLGAAGFLAEPEVARYFRQHGNRRGDRFGDAGRGRLRVCEAAQIDRNLSPSSCFNLVGAAQVGKSSLTGMRLLHRLGGAIPVWPFDNLPDHGPVVVEIYTSIAARAAGVPKGRAKIRSAEELRIALDKLGSPNCAPLDNYGDDHATDAILTAAWLRTTAARAELWSPADLTPAIAQTEGWTFGVP